MTSSGSEIRVWNTRKRAELLRIRVPNINCLCIALNKAGTCIASGWDDGKIRAFLPQSGKLQWVIPDAHSDAVTALSFTNDCQRIVTGGRDGRVRVWNVGGRAQVMELSFKEHKREITSIKVTSNDEEAVSASADGSCLIWNLRRGARANAFFASTVFRAVAYHPDESQLVTSGSDKRISYWDAADCTAIRVLEGSTEEVLSLDISKDGQTVVTAGKDRTVTVWKYEEGEVIATGAGHSGWVTRASMAPDSSIVVSGSTEGEIFIWEMTPSA